MIEYVRTGYTTDADLTELDLFTSVYLPYGMDWTAGNIDEHGKTFFALRRAFSGGWTRELPLFFYRGGREVSRDVEMPAEWVALAEDSLRPIHPTVMGPPVRMVTVVGQDGDAVAFPEATAEWMMNSGVAKEDR